MATSDGTRLGPGPASALAIAWLCFISVMFSINWHPVKLVTEMSAVVPKDVAAAIYSLAVSGILPFIYLCIFVLAALGAGNLIIKPFRISAGRAGRAILSFGLGFAALSYLTLFLGLSWRFDAAGRAALVLVLAFFAAAGALFVRGMLKGMSLRGRAGWWDAAFVVVFAAVCAFLLAKALKPAVFYDAVTYHLGVPNYYLQEGGIGYIPWDSYSNFPFMAEMVYTLGMLVSGLKFAQLTSVAMFAAISLLVYEFTRAHLPEVPPGFPAMLTLLTPAFMENTVQYSNDLHLAFFSLLVVYCFLMLEKTGERGWAALMGTFTGVCLGTKYIALVSISVPAFAGICYIALRRSGGTRGEGLRLLAYFIVPAVAVSSPWLVKNLVFTGNPFYPALYGLFGGDDMTSKLSAVHAMNHPSISDSVMGLVLHPWRMFMEGPQYITANYRAAAYLGPVIIMFAPLTLMFKDVSPAVKRLWLYISVLFVLWCAAFPLTRYLYPAVAAMTIATAYAAVRAVREWPKPAKAVFALFIIAGLAFDACLGHYLVDKWTDAYGFERTDETDEEYLASRSREGGVVMLHTAPVYEYINNNTGKDAVVLVIGDAQHLYINKRHQYTYLSATTPYDIFVENAGNPEKVAGILEAEGVTHIVYNPEELRRLQRTGFIGFEESGDAEIEAFLESGYARLVLKADLPGRPVYLFELAHAASGRG